MEWHVHLTLQVLQIAEERRQQAQKRSAAKVEKKSKESLDSEKSLEAEKSKKSLISKDSKQSAKSKESLKATDLEVPLSDLPTTRSGISQLNIPCSESALVAIAEASEGEEDIGLDSTDNVNGNNNENRNRNNDAADEDEKSTSAEVRTNCLYQGFLQFIKLNQFTIHPDSTAHNRFNSLLCMTSFIVCWLVTYEATFQHHHWVIITFSYLCDLLFWVEIYINFHLGYIDSFGDLVDEYEAISKNYSRKLDYFLLDLLSVLPFDILALAAPSGDRLLVLSYLRLTRLLRLTHISRFFGKWEKELDVKWVSFPMCSSKNVSHD